MFLPRVTKRIQQRREKRQKSNLLLVACLLAVLSLDAQKSLHGRYLVSKNIERTRKQIDELFQELRTHQRRAYRMSLDQVTELHEKLLPELLKEFLTTRKWGRTPNGVIHSKIRLSAALRFFAGGSPLDIMLTLGISR